MIAEPNTLRRFIAKGFFTSALYPYKIRKYDRYSYAAGYKNIVRLGLTVRFGNKVFMKRFSSIISVLYLIKAESTVKNLNVIYTCTAFDFTCGNICACISHIIAGAIEFTVYIELNHTVSFTQGVYLYIIFAGNYRIGFCLNSLNVENKLPVCDKMLISLPPRSIIPSVGTAESVSLRAKSPRPETP